MDRLTLALDIGNVCIAIDPANAVRGLSASEIPPLQAAAREMECGRMTEEEFLSFCRRIRKNAPSLQECRAVFNSVLIAPVPGMNELVSSFPSRKIHAVFFSDISTIHLARVRELFPAAAAVPEGVYSFEAGAMKPSESMLRAFERRYGRPDLYVDDRPDLVAAAIRFGWDAICFTGAAELSRVLDDRQKKGDIQK